MINSARICPARFVRLSTCSALLSWIKKMGSPPAVLVGYWSAAPG